MLELFQKTMSTCKRALYISPAISLVLSSSVSAYVTPSFTEYPVATGYESPSRVASAGGVVGYINRPTGSIYPTVLSIMTPSGTVTQNYNLLRAGDTMGIFSSLATDNSGNIWFAGCSGTSSTNEDVVFGYVNPSTATLTTYVYVPSVTKCGSSGGFSITGLTIDAAGNPWMIANRGYYHYSSVMSFNPATGAYRTGYGLGIPMNNWKSITAGPNNSLWIVDSDNSYGHRVQQLTLDTTTYTVTGMNTFTAPSGSDLGDIVAGPDGNLWFPDWNSQNIYKMTPGGTFTPYLVSSGKPSMITTGPDGALWFTANTTTSGYIGRLTTAGAMTQYASPNRNNTITSGPDNALWFTETNGKIGRLGY